MKKGLSGLATIGTTAPFIGLFGTVIGIINAFRGMAITGSGGIARRVRRHRRGARHHRPRPLRGHPGGLDVQHFINNIERFQVEMSNSATELIDYFIKRRGAARQLST